MRIEKPCPAAISGMKKDGNSYFCNNCSNMVTDFRGKTNEEILRTISRGSCGIFTPDQLDDQPQMAWKQRFVFYSLSLLSLLGFAVHPVSAQIKPSTHVEPSTSDTTSQEQKVDEKDDPPEDTVNVERKEDTNRKKTIFRRKRYRVLGCPDF